jgi:hypothetical protein
MGSAVSVLSQMYLYSSHFDLHLIVAPQLNVCWQCNYSTKTRHAGLANEEPIMGQGKCGWQNHSAEPWAFLWKKNFTNELDKMSKTELKKF